MMFRKLSRFSNTFLPGHKFSRLCVSEKSSDRTDVKINRFLDVIFTHSFFKTTTKLHKGGGVTHHEEKNGSCLVLFDYKYI